MSYTMRKQCELCFASAEYVLKDMDLCEYHYIQFNNCSNKLESLPALVDWLHE